MSKKNPINEFRVLLDLSALSADDTAREQLCTSIAKLAPQSPLYSDPTVQAAVANVGKTFTTFVTARQAAAQSAKQHALDATASSNAGTANDKSLLLLRTLVQNAAASESDLTSMAFTAYTGRPPAPPLLPPEQIDVVQGKKGTGQGARDGARAGHHPAQVHRADDDLVPHHAEQRVRRGAGQRQAAQAERPARFDGVDPVRPRPRRAAVGLVRGRARGVPVRG